MAINSSNATRLRGKKIASTAPSDGQVLTFDSTNGWQPETPSSGGDMVVASYANMAYLNGPGFTLDNNLPVIGYTNNANQDASFSIKVPVGATSISSIKVFYTRKTTGNLYLKFFTYYNTTTSVTAQGSDTTDTDTTYESGGSDGRLESVTVPSGAYNGIGAVAAHNILTLKVFRSGASANDTYESAWYVTHVEFTFA